MILPRIMIIMDWALSVELKYDLEEMKIVYKFSENNTISYSIIILE